MRLFALATLGFLAVAPVQAATAPAQLLTHGDQGGFVLWTGATAQPALPNLGIAPEGTVVGDMTFSLGPGATQLIFGTSGLGFETWSTLIPGNALALSGNASFTVDFAAPVGSFGFSFHEPSRTGPPPDATNADDFIDSVFEVTLRSGGDLVGRTQFERRNDVLAFFGVHNPTLFDRVEIVEIVGGAENEYFGQFYTGTSVVPVPAALPLLATGVIALGWLRRRSARR